jgi:two-component system phosphate regulon response regulator OmpR
MSSFVENCASSEHAKTGQGKVAVLMVDDDEVICEEIRGYLEAHGMRVECATDIAGARRRLESSRPDMVLLDLWLGGENGFDLLREIRRQQDVPCIMMTAQDDVTDKIVGLELGADEYLFKPVNLRELLARMRTLLRRTTSVSAQAGAVAPLGRWHFDPLRRNLVRPDGTPELLTSAECDLLIALVAREGQVQTREALCRLVFRREWDTSDRSLDGLVVKLRRKLELLLEGPAVIKTVRGQGYIFTGFQ